jgi:hypothetical protein
MLAARLSSAQANTQTEGDIMAHAHSCSERASERAALLGWIGGLGAVTAEALAARQAISVASARGRLLAARRDGLLLGQRPLTAEPTLYTLSPVGAGQCGLDRCRVSASNAHHLIVCAGVAVALERCYPDHRVQGERELRRDERERGGVLASALLGMGFDGEPVRHRPDLVLWPNEPAGALPVAVEVELTIKAPRRLLQICRAWARARCVAGVLYLASPAVERPLERAVVRASADERVLILPLGLLMPEPSD